MRLRNAQGSAAGVRVCGGLWRRVFAGRRMAAGARGGLRARRVSPSARHRRWRCGCLRGFARHLRLASGLSSDILVGLAAGASLFFIARRMAMARPAGGRLLRLTPFEGGFAALAAGIMGALAAALLIQPDSQPKAIRMEIGCVSVARPDAPRYGRRIAPPMPEPS